ncbi:nose resistant to fluoxetine protein 6-like isoform X2 [Leguminivora glycinivorella]|nr:nose resistant to fluoxetine protein 6-like isoform X2 [Leguminivora glycinivorella]
MLDASAKIPSGILQGNGIQLGDFDQCLGSRARVQLETGSVVKVQGKYCLARLDVKAEHEELEVPVHLAQAKNLIRSRIDDPGHFVPRFSTLSWGVCVPSPCNPEDAEVVIKDSLKHYQHTSGLVIRVKIDERDCHVYESSWDEWFELPTVLTLSFYAVIILLVLIATVQDYLSSGSSEEPPSEDADDKAECDQEAEEGEKEKEDAPKTDSFLSSFSLYSTLMKLTAPGTNDEISCIHGVRGLATIALLVAHKFLPVAVTPYNNRLKITEVVSSPLWSWCRAGWIYTDCFLLLSGTLTAHRMSADGSGVKRLFSRYLRLTPALLAVVLFYAYIWDNISTGPMWGTLVTKNAEICQEGWWWNLLYIQNWFGFEDMCAPQTHQLALDMQLTIVGGLIVWLMQIKPSVFKFLLPTVIGLAAFSRYSTVIEHRLTMLAYHGVSVSQLYRTARLSYTSVYHRCTPYLIGISLGIALQKPSQLNKILLALGWLTSGALWGLVWWAGLDSGNTQYRYNALFAANYAAIAPIAASLAIAWVIYAVHNGYCESLANFLCCRPLVLISRLSYALYLCQFIVFLTEAATVRTTSEFSLLSLIDLHEISLIILSSTLLTLTFVIPMQSLHKVFTFSSNSEKEDNKEESEDKPDENHIEATAESTEDHEEEIDVPQIKTRQLLVAHREVLEEIPEADIEYEIQRDKLEGLEEILEEEEEEGADDDVRENHLDDEDLEVIEEEQGGEDDFWGDRDEDYVPRRASYVQDDDEDIDEWEWTANGSQNGAQHYRYTR